MNNESFYYGTFLVTDLLRSKSETHKEMPCDEIWDIGKRLYKMFEKSVHNDPSISEFEALQSFVNSFSLERMLKKLFIDFAKNEYEKVINFDNVVIDGVYTYSDATKVYLVYENYYYNTCITIDFETYEIKPYDSVVEFESHLAESYHESFKSDA